MRNIIVTVTTSRFTLHSCVRFLLLCVFIFGNSFFFLDCGGENNIDRTPPEVKILSPGNGDDIGTSINIAVSATDNVAVSSVLLFVDNVLLENKTSPPYNFIWNSDFWGDGKSHLISVQAIDPSLNVSLLRTIKLDVLKTQKPQVEIISPRFNQVVPDSNVMFKWKPVENTRKYKIEIFPTAISKIPILQFETTKAETVISLPEEKTYSWRVIPITIGKLEGKWSSQAIFHRTGAYTAIDGEKYFDNLSSILKDKNGGYILCGSTQSNGGGAVLLKYSISGNLLWKRFFGGTDLCFFSSLIQTDDGGFILAGIKHEQGTENDIWLVKTDSEGFLVWTKTVFRAGNQNVKSLAELQDGGFVVCGITMLKNEETEIFEQYYDDRNELITTRSHIVSPEITVHNISYVHDGEVLIVGTERDSINPQKTNGIVLKLSSSGDEEWKQIFSEVGNTEFSHAVENDSTIFLCGSTYINSGNQDGFIAAVTWNGNKLWKKTYGGLDNDMAVSLTVQGKHIAFCGQYGSNAIHGSDAWLTLLDHQGNIIFSKTYGGKNVDVALSISSSFNGGYVCTGYTTSFTAGSCDGFLLITDSTGMVQFPK